MYPSFLFGYLIFLLFFDFRGTCVLLLDPRVSELMAWLIAGSILNVVDVCLPWLRGQLVALQSKNFDFKNAPTQQVYSFFTFPYHLKDLRFFSVISGCLLGTWLLFFK